MRKIDKAIAVAAFLLYAASFVAMCGCSGRVRPGVGFSNDGQRVGMDLGTYDTSIAHPVTGAAPGDECPGGVCGVPDPVVPVRKSQIAAAQREIGARSESNGVAWLVGGCAAALLLVLAYVAWSARKVVKS